MIMSVLFRCAKALVRFGALVNLPSEEVQETPLHIAAKHGLYDHLHLYLRYGATVDKKNSLEETALSVACREAKNMENQESYLQVCKLLLAYGADVNTVDEEIKTPLHKACRNTNHGLVQLLLQRQADVNAIDYNGAYPMSCVLQAAAFKQELKPHLTVQTLLNHGSQKIWPTAFVKVLKSCASVPEIIEMLYNSYPHLPISEKWVEVIPKEDFQVGSDPLEASPWLLSGSRFLGGSATPMLRQRQRQPMRFKLPFKFINCGTR
ncbi:hypothetical protein JD844_023349 [Phrynosoma platyrhinos]|uniref:Uncharacterized protein n=1 Tax=Phrynosoma platyrhinos TaxID=52577 RepID=A0ABQ7SWG8_PHRPL|nr:hypothetical protein JD844_023349 [Phrynosoma platyrhinos]